MVIELSILDLTLAALLILALAGLPLRLGLGMGDSTRPWAEPTWKVADSVS